MHVDGKYISTYFITMVGCQTWIQCKSVFCPYIIHPTRHTCECCFSLAISKLKIASLPYKLPQYDHWALHLVWYLHLLEGVLLDASSNPRNVEFGLLRTLIMFFTGRYWQIVETTPKTIYRFYDFASMGAGWAVGL
jgi:hypothetical protein